MSYGRRVDVIGQMILGATPAIIPQLYAFYRIKKFRKGILVLLITAGLIAFDAAIDYELDSSLNKNSIFHGFTTGEEIAGIIIGMLFPTYFVRKWTLEYNEKIDSSYT